MHSFSGYPFLFPAALDTLAQAPSANDIFGPRLHVEKEKGDRVGGGRKSSPTRVHVCVRVRASGLSTRLSWPTLRGGEIGAIGPRG